ncbi:class I SAM-dependent methyltransferase [Aspergillus saccharolyticus JOP 1030-1]|uniref:S-adenosyl-L-methionine-dependent methyltransferase n=1 Tax=Aspergillus saccharolyticus JOP 1030-1 TaxID=1450539 RepID=A0A318Z8C1_9EURO|nr:S-adenosyl-L-methionine-dependent methyltransferase [Aspergillus saccharolyticus JOP 1030-1]PYH43575.1 S-adenosyl-L-methionine-dependent methyltransferase [Aspergillus saccharolyticus JOP 1030-1]
MGFDLKIRLRSYFDKSQPLLGAFKYIWTTYRSNEQTPGPGPSIQRRAFAKWFTDVAPHFIAFEETTSLPSLAAAAHGTVLELGPGAGNQLQRYNRDQITTIYGVEPNAAFREPLRAKIEQLHLDAIYVPVFCDVMDTAALERQGIVDGSIDCVTSFGVLCSVDRPEEVVARLWRLLRPGGELVVWEHGASEDWVTWGVQKVWNLLWPVALDGCRLDRKMEEILLTSAEWEVLDLRREGEKWSMMPRVSGVLRKVQRD